MIERRASLDALACLTILLREAHELGRMELSFKIAKSLCKVLVMIGDVLNGHGISQPLHDYYEEIILPLACWQEKRISLRIPMNFATEYDCKPASQNDLKPTTDYDHKNAT